ncbi:6424_t:CDS:2, partial [Dentiscutata heterogama]
LAKSETDQEAAKLELARCYANGKGVTKNKDKALQLYLELSKSEEYQRDACKWLTSYYRDKDEEMSYKYSTLQITLSCNGNTRALRALTFRSKTTQRMMQFLVSG